MTRPYKLQLAAAIFCLASFAGCVDENAGPTGDDRSLFTGNWTCTEDSKIFNHSVYPVSIALVGDNDSVSIKNFYQLGNSVLAIALVSGGSITIPFQDVSGGIHIQGTGLMSNNNSKINFTYYTDDAGVKDTVTAVYSK